uniref:Uncharacterized protein n=1 Tax=Helianthus annuus TaxID=4232 RepID=A0A251V0T9_HELAN
MHVETTKYRPKIVARVVRQKVMSWGPPTFARRGRRFTSLCFLFEDPILKRCSEKD